MSEPQLFKQCPLFLLGKVLFLTEGNKTQEESDKFENDWAFREPYIFKAMKAREFADTMGLSISLG